MIEWFSGVYPQSPFPWEPEQTGFHLLKTATRGSKPGGEQKKGRTNYGNENHNYRLQRGRFSGRGNHAGNHHPGHGGGSAEAGRAGH
nr:MAG TPA: hypothetical protein [Caudoviricetes sp.]